MSRELGSIVEGHFEKIPDAPLTLSNGQVSKELLKLLHEQISHESYNAHLYLKIYAYLKNKGLDNLSVRFQTQFAEENTHQQKIVDYLTDRNEEVIVIETPKVDFIPMNIIQIAQAYLAQEQMTTKRLKEIAMVAWNETDLLTFKFLQDMLEIQRTEEEEAFTFLDQASMTQNDPKAVLMWNMGYAEVIEEN